MTENIDKILSLVKATLGYKSSVRDELLKVIVKSVIDELEIQKRIKLALKMLNTLCLSLIMQFFDTKIRVQVHCLEILNIALEI